MNSNRNITLSEALCEATHQAMKERDEVFIIGEGVTDPKFIFGTTKNLLDKFGKKRVIDLCVNKINTFAKRHKIRLKENPVLIELLEFGIKRIS